MSSKYPGPCHGSETVDLCAEVLKDLSHRPDTLDQLTPQQRQQLQQAALQLTNAFARQEQQQRYARRQAKRRTRQAQRREGGPLPPNDKASRKARDQARYQRTQIAQDYNTARAKAGLYQPNSRKRQEHPAALSALLEEPQRCYVCKALFYELHHFYARLCPACAGFHYQKRHASAPLDGYTAIVTGGRVKIGYQAALKLLRAGADVVITTRFPRDAARRYAQEDDVARWQHRLQIYGLDLRHLSDLSAWISFMSTKLQGLDILINNAAQTIWRPPSDYQPLQQRELEWQAVQTANELRWLRGQTAFAAHLVEQRNIAASKDMTATGPEAAIGAMLQHAPHQRKQPLQRQDGQTLDLLLPGVEDDGVPRDLRETNSWRQTMAEVSTPELLEVFVINAVAPFILNRDLRGLMRKSPNDARFIINVSAMEGQFSRGTKTIHHPHTNMAKAALNMMTRTAAPEYAKDRIYVNSVDTGWVTHEGPRSWRREDPPPLDVIDGAARICDPIFDYQREGKTTRGAFLKDYASVRW